jgi:hypothetical protein
VTKENQIDEKRVQVNYFSRVMDVKNEGDEGDANIPVF